MEAQEFTKVEKHLQVSLVCFCFKAKRHRAKKGGFVVKVVSMIF